LHKKKIRYCSAKKGLVIGTNGKTGYVKDLSTPDYISVEKKRREFGAHMTSIDVFKKFIFPEIKNILYNYTWVDLFAGEGNLILPILDEIPKTSE